MSDDVLFDKRPDGVGLITLNRPDSLNAMGGDLIPLLGQFLEQCERDREVRCVAITGNGRGFCAGGDVRGMQSRNDDQAAPRPDAGQNPVARMVASLERNTVGLRRIARLHVVPAPQHAQANSCPGQRGGRRSGPERRACLRHPHRQ